MTDIPTLRAAYAAAGATLAALVEEHAAQRDAATCHADIIAAGERYLPLIRAAGKAHFEASKAHQIAIRAAQLAAKK